MKKLNSLDVFAASAIIAAAMNGLAMVAEAQAARVEESRDVEAFSEVSMSGLGRITVNVGEAQGVTIEADERVMEFIVTEVVRGELRIYRERGSRREFRRYGENVEVTVNVPSLEAFGINGSGRSRVLNLDATGFEFDANGSGRSYISGTCETGKFDLNGSGRLDAEDLSCGDVEIDANGSGGIKMTITGDVEIDAAGSGAIDLYGTPRLTRLTGRGSGPVNIGGQ
jgi:Putative auto-transporter adhesin, head GIN domain